MKYKRNTYKNNHCKNTHTHRNRLAKQQINRATQTAEIRRLLVRSAPGSPERLRYPSAVSYCVGALRGQVTLARDAGRRPISQSFGTLDTPRMGSWDHLTHREWGQDLERHIADMDARHPSSPDAGLRCILRGACPASRSKDSYPIHRRLFPRPSRRQRGAGGCRPALPAIRYYYPMSRSRQVTSRGSSRSTADDVNQTNLTDDIKQARTR